MVHDLCIQEVIKRLAPVAIAEPFQRIGGGADGGYLVPVISSHTDISDVFSPGVADVCDFELHYAEQGVNCHLCDFSVDAPPLAHRNFKFIKKYLGAATDGDHLCMEDWILMSSPGSGDWILQMDIEGAEYSALLSCPDRLLDRFSILVVEFHAFDSIRSTEYFPLISMAISKLLRYFIPVHAHWNNAAPSFNIGSRSFPACFEMTLCRIGCISPLDGIRATLPHPLDKPNSSSRPVSDFTKDSFFL